MNKELCIKVGKWNNSILRCTVKKHKLFLFDSGFNLGLDWCTLLIFSVIKCGVVGCKANKSRNSKDLYFVFCQIKSVFFRWSLNAEFGDHNLHKGVDNNIKVLVTSINVLITCIRVLVTYIKLLITSIKVLITYIKVLITCIKVLITYIKVLITNIKLLITYIKMLIIYIRFC
jgi:hypothetical protein